MAIFSAIRSLARPVVAPYLFRPPRIGFPGFKWTLSFER
jgi:hypothetical protein